MRGRIIRERSQYRVNARLANIVCANSAREEGPSDHKKDLHVLMLLQTVDVGNKKLDKTI